MTDEELIELVKTGAEYEPCDSTRELMGAAAERLAVLRAERDAAVRERDALAEAVIASHMPAIPGRAPEVVKLSKFSRAIALARAALGTDGEGA